MEFAKHYWYSISADNKTFTHQYLTDAEAEAERSMGHFVKKDESKYTLLVSEEMKEIFEKHEFQPSQIYIEGDNEHAIEIGQYTPCGEDWYEYICFTETAEDFIVALEERSNSFDVDEEVVRWIDNRGSNGIPASIRDLLEDAEWKQEKLRALALDMIKGFNKEGEHNDT